MIFETIRFYHDLMKASFSNFAENKNNWVKTFSELNVSKWLRWGYAIIIGIALNFILDIIFSLIYSQYQLFQPLNHYINSVVVTFVVIEALLFVNKKLNIKYPWEKKHIYRFLIQLLFAIIISNVIVFATRIPLLLLSESTEFIQFYDEFILAFYISVLCLIYSIVNLTVFLVGKWQKSMAELERFKKENAEYKFELLRSQLNPHFLFNSLSTLSSLVYKNQDKAGLFIRELADVYRYILENRDKDIVTLEKEIQFAQSYIQLNKLRFEDNLLIKNDIATNIKNSKIAPLTIQLLLENAIKHNIISKSKPLNISISINNGYLTVKNNKQLKRTREYSSNMGLKNITNRYSFLSNKPVEIIDNNKEFIVKIPLLY